MNIVTIDLNKIDDSNRLRPVDPVYARVLAESMDENGQMTPIEVGSLRQDGMHKLISGAHRIAAMRLRGQTQIAAIVFEGARDEAELREIDENLCRADLNDLDRAIFLGRRKEAYERLHPQARSGKGKQKQDVAKMATILRFTLETSRQTGQAERTIRRLVHRYDHLAPAVRDRLRGTWLASVGTELDALAGLSPAEQVQVVDMLLREDDPQPTVAAAKIIVRGIRQRPHSIADEQLSKLMSAWKKNTNREARKQFRAFLASPESNKVEA